MYNLIEYSSDYCETTGSLQHKFGSSDDFKSLMYEAKLLENTKAQPNPNHANGILKNTTISGDHLNLINCKVKLTLKWTKYCVLSAAGNDNTNANPDNIIFTLKDTKLYVPVVTLSAKDNKKLSEVLSKGCK